MITNEVIIDSIATGQNIKKLMKLHNHSVAHLSKLSGLSPTTITNYRSGYNVPNLHNLCVLASIYGVQMSLWKKLCKLNTIKVFYDKIY